jgi:DNA-binding response OmpR family regulator
MKHSELLIVDDEKRYADMLAKRLALRGCPCEVCYNGQAAIELLEKRPFLLIILDLQLPDVYGTEVLRHIRALREDVPVIILTGHGTERDRQECLELGARAFLHKPLDIDRLIQLWRQAGGESA